MEEYMTITLSQINHAKNKPFLIGGFYNLGLLEICVFNAILIAKESNSMATSKCSRGCMNILAYANAKHGWEDKKQESILIKQKKASNVSDLKSQTKCSTQFDLRQNGQQAEAVQQEILVIFALEEFALWKMNVRCQNSVWFPKKMYLKWE